MKPTRWAIALLTASVFVALAGGDVRAEPGATVTEFGWWSQVPGATTPAGGGFQVADSPAGPLSVAAIRVSVTAATLSSGTLVLPESEQVGTAALQVCLTRSAWSPSSPGPWNQRPTPDCAAPIALVRDAAALSWTAQVLPLLSSGPGEVSLMVVPAPAATPVPTPFQISFRGAGLQAEAGSAVPEPAGSSGPASGFDSTFGGASAVGSPSDFGVPAPLPEPAVAPVPANEQIVAAPAQVGGRFPQRGDVGIPGGGADQPWGRLPLLVLAAAAIGAGTSVGRMQLRARGLLAA